MNSERISTVHNCSTKTEVSSMVLHWSQGNSNPCPAPEVRAKEEQHVSGPRHWEAVQEGMVEALTAWHFCSQFGRPGRRKKREKHQASSYEFSQNKDKEEVVHRYAH